MSNFWKNLSKPFTVLAPMEDVTDVVFREIIAGLPRPNVFFTEFASADGLCSAGYDKTVQKLRFTENQRPIVAQIWGKNPENLYKAAKIVKDLNFDGVDINMGCPVRAVTKTGAGAALSTNQPLAGEIIDAVKKGAKGIPVSVKTRIGFNKIDTENWISFLLNQDIAALTVHGRTAKQMSKVPANWEEISKAVELKVSIAPNTVLIGNGDIKSFKQTKEMHEKYGVDGTMIARGIFSNPWVFEKTLEPTMHDKSEYLYLLLKHVDLYEATWGSEKNFEVIKKFFKMYVNNFEGASQLRQSLMECKTPKEVHDVLDSLTS